MTAELKKPNKPKINKEKQRKKHQHHKNPSESLLLKQGSLCNAAESVTLQRKGPSDSVE